MTIDALTADGEFLGGLILPGPELMAEALATGTAGLPRQPGQFEVFPTSTANAIFSGALQAVCGAIERIERSSGCRRARRAADRDERRFGRRWWPRSSAAR